MAVMKDPSPEALDEGEPGFTVWLTGLPCSGKSTIASKLVEHLRSSGRKVEVLDGDIVREHLSKGLGFSRADRDTNVLRIGFVAQLLSRNGVAVVVAAVSPYAATREQVRQQIPGFVEVFVECPLEECERRDVKGMYKKARAGTIGAFTGVDDPYEPPIHPDVTVRTREEAVDESLRKVLDKLAELGHLKEG
ncbi:MAG TPA: adenylyl-sulfate kinase [Polyangiaceae bacterium]|nr:adenylyl-sulfate kinase [Polyangiaceae bacterium]